MFPAINAWTFPPELSPAAQIVAAATAGFEGLELVVGKDGPLTPDTSPAVFSELTKLADDSDIELVSVATGLFWELNYGLASATDRDRAKDLTLRLLDRAAAAEAEALLVVPAVVGRADEPRARVSYSDALHRTIEALSALRYEAESRDVVLAVENVWNRFLLSPVEAADLLDGINSPCVGWYFDVGNVLAFGYPTDWIRTLAGRIVRVHVKDYDLRRPGSAGFCPLGEGSVDWPGVVAALQAVGYDGPLTYEGAGDPAAICGQLNEILATE